MNRNMSLTGVMIKIGFITFLGFLQKKSKFPRYITKKRYRLTPELQKYKRKHTQTTTINKESTQNLFNKQTTFLQI